MSFGNATRESLAVIWRRMSDAMGQPRRHCFIQQHHRLIAQHAAGGYPLAPAPSLRVRAEAGFESLPEYFALVTGATAAPRSAQPVSV